MALTNNNTDFNSSDKTIPMPDWNNQAYKGTLPFPENSNGTELKTTFLYAWHLDNGASMADFGGYHMPLWYNNTGVKNEHLAVLESAGIFDTSHMACITVKGNHAFELLQFCFTRNLNSLEPGRCMYGAFLDDRGFCIDDAIIYKFSRKVYMICVNSGMGEKITSHLIENKERINIRNGLSLEITDLTQRIAKMDIQGKNSARILAEIIKNPEKIFKRMPYFSFKIAELHDGTSILLSRSGYTGEFGFEIFVTPWAIVDLWKDILKAGEKFNILACGLGARDSLRTGAVLPLSHQDIGKSKFINHPWDFALAFDGKKRNFTKDFLGKEELLKPDNNYIYPFVGDDLRKVTPSDKTFVMDESHNKIGTVLTCVTDIAIGWINKRIFSTASPDLPRHAELKGLSCGFIMVAEKLEYGTRLFLQEGRRIINIRTVRDIRPHRTARKPIRNFL